MTLDTHSRYFLIHRDSATHHAMNTMEEAGASMLKSISTLEADGRVVFQVTMGGTIKGLSVAYKDAVQDIPYLMPEVVKAFRQVAPEILNDKRFFVILEPAKIEDTSQIPEVAMRSSALFEKISEDVGKLGLAQNWLAGLSSMRNVPEKESAKAVLTVSGHSFYPEAHRVFADWVVKMPPYIVEAGNSFVPPDSTAVNVAEVESMMAGMAITDFRHEHARARQAIRNLQKIELNHYQK